MYSVVLICNLLTIPKALLSRSLHQFMAGVFGNP